MTRRGTPEGRAALRRGIASQGDKTTMKAKQAKTLQPATESTPFSRLVSSKDPEWKRIPKGKRDPAAAFKEAFNLQHGSSMFSNRPTMAERIASLQLTGEDLVHELKRQIAAKRDRRAAIWGYLDLFEDEPIAMAEADPDGSERKLNRRYLAQCNADLKLLEETLAAAGSPAEREEIPFPGPRGGSEPWRIGGSFSPL